MNFHDDLYYTNLLYGGSNADNQSLTGDYDATSQFVTPCQIPIQQEPSTKQKHRARNFTIKEDNLLISAWLNISMDAVHGNFICNFKTFLLVWKNSRIIVEK